MMAKIKAGLLSLRDLFATAWWIILVVGIGFVWVMQNATASWAVGAAVCADGRSNWYKGVQLVAVYLVLALIMFSLTRPGWRGTKLKGEHFIFLIDTSASMQATDVAPNRISFTLLPINDAPVNTVPAAQITPEDTPRVFSAANGNLISIADLDADEVVERIVNLACERKLLPEG